jgi:hypothetical protein
LSLLNRRDRALVAITGGLSDSPDRFIRETAADIKAMSELYLGALIEAEVAKLGDQYTAGVEHMSPAERRFWRSEAREQWIKKAAGLLGDPDACERLRAIGRGEDVDA